MSINSNDRNEKLWLWIVSNIRLEENPNVQSGRFQYNSTFERNFLINSFFLGLHLNSNCSNVTVRQVSWVTKKSLISKAILPSFNWNNTLSSAITYLKINMQMSNILKLLQNIWFSLIVASFLIIANAASQSNWG